MLHITECNIKKNVTIIFTIKNVKHNIQKKHTQVVIRDMNPSLFLWRDILKIAFCLFSNVMEICGMNSG